MKTIRLFGTRGLNLILGAALGVSLSFAPPAFAQNVPHTSVIVNPDGKVTFLGTLDGRIYSEAVGINNSGQVAGNRIDPNVRSPAFITGPDGIGMTTLDNDFGGSSAGGINDAGQVVGSTATANGGYIQTFQAFMTGHNGTGLTVFPIQSFFGDHATAINESAQVVINGSYQEGSSAYITGPNGIGMTDLGALGGGLASDINDAGQVVGHVNTIGGGYSFRAFMTGPNGMGMTILGTFGDDSFATSINDSGQVVGYYYTFEEDREFPRHAFITGPNGKGMTDLGKLGGDLSIATDINDSGQVVGYSTTAAGSTHAFITGPNGEGMTDLNSIADLPGGVYLRSAEGINNLGQIIATATVTVIPEPASYALMLAGLGLVGFLARRKKLPENILDNILARG